MNIFQKNNIGAVFALAFTTKRKTICILAFLLILTVAVYGIPDTFGRFMQGFIGIDSAFAAKFNIEITTPDEFDSISSENQYQHYFLTEGATKRFSFRIRNGSEVLVSCRPYINNNVQYCVLVDEEIQNEFLLDMGEAVDFQLIVMSEGLSTEITEASLLIDIQQMERA